MDCLELIQVQTIGVIGNGTQKIGMTQKSSHATLKYNPLEFFQEKIKTITDNKIESLETCVLYQKIIFLSNILVFYCSSCPLSTASLSRFHVLGRRIFMHSTVKRPVV